MPPASSSALVSVLCLACHVGFFHAQLVGSGQISVKDHLSFYAGLFQARVSGNMSYRVGGPVKAAMVIYEEASCAADNVCVDHGASSICSMIACHGVNVSTSLLQMSYASSLRHMWDAEDANTGRATGRPAALCLLLFSFLWPHVKLLTLHLLFYHRSASAKARRAGNFWLASFGKWSFIDVMVMATIIGVFDLEARQHINAPLLVRLMKASGIETLDVAESMLRRADEDDLRCNVTGKISMSGLAATYSFCLSVVLSLSIGVLVETLEGADGAAPRILQLDEIRSIRDEAAHEDSGSGGHPSAVAAARPQSPRSEKRYLVASHNSAQSSPVVADRPAPSERASSADPRLLLVGAPGARKHALMCALTMALTLLSVTLPIVRRIITGSLATFIKRELDIDYDLSYSLWDLMIVSVHHGGLDLLLAGTFVIFILVGPLLRTATQLALLTCPMALQRQRGLFRLSRHISVFYALEVMVVALPLVNISFGPLSSLILDPDDVPACEVLNSRYHTGKVCLMINVELLSGYVVLCAAALVYMMTGWDQSTTHKFMEGILFCPAGGLLEQTGRRQSRSASCGGRKCCVRPYLVV